MRDIFCKDTFFYTAPLFADIIHEWLWLLNSLVFYFNRNFDGILIITGNFFLCYDSLEYFLMSYQVACIPHFIVFNSFDPGSNFSEIVIIYIEFKTSVLNSAFEGYVE